MWICGARITAWLRRGDTASACERTTDVEAGVVGAGVVLRWRLWPSVRVSKLGWGVGAGVCICGRHRAYVQHVRTRFSQAGRGTYGHCANRLDSGWRHGMLQGFDILYGYGARVQEGLRGVNCMVGGRTCCGGCERQGAWSLSRQNYAVRVESTYDGHRAAPCVPTLPDVTRYRGPCSGGVHRWWRSGRLATTGHLCEATGADGLC